MRRLETQMYPSLIARFLSGLMPAGQLHVAEVEPSASGVAPATAQNAQIRRLSITALPSIAYHVMALNERDRYMRFGFQASDQQVHDYIDQIDFERDEVFGIFGADKQLLGMAHLAYSAMLSPLGGPEHNSASSMAEFGVSVNSAARGMGLGGRLFAYCARRAACKGIDQMFIHTINKNIPMIKIIKRAGAEISRDGGDIDAYLALPANNPWLRMRITPDDALSYEEGYGIKVELDNLKDSADKPPNPENS